MHNICLCWNLYVWVGCMCSKGIQCHNAFEPLRHNAFETLYNIKVQTKTQVDRSQGHFVYRTQFVPSFQMLFYRRLRLGKCCHYEMVDLIELSTAVIRKGGWGG